MNRFALAYSVAASFALAACGGAAPQQAAKPSPPRAAAEPSPPQAATVPDKLVPPLITHQSGVGFDATVAAAKQAIESRGFKIFAVIDHAAGAAKVDLDLSPATLIIFGNPNGGTPLMQGDIRLGLELPLRVLVYVDPNEAGSNAGGSATVAHPDYAAIIGAYEGDNGARIEKISGALKAIATEATTETSAQ